MEVNGTGIEDCEISSGMKRPAAPTSRRRRSPPDCEAARRRAGRTGDCRQLILAADPPAQVDLRIYVDHGTVERRADDQ